MSQVEEIKKYLKIINSNYEKFEFQKNDLLVFCIEEVLDRLKIYLNIKEIPNELNRIISKIISKQITQIANDTHYTTEGAFISSIVDNGQSIQFENEIAKHFSNATDEEIIEGYYKILKNYRRLNVVGNSYNDEK